MPTYGGRTYGGGPYEGALPVDPHVRLHGVGHRHHTGTAVLTETVPVTAPSGDGFDSNGRRRSGHAILTITAAPHTLPAGFKYLPTLSEVYPAPVIINGQPYADSAKTPWTPTSKTPGFWGAYDIVIGGKNVTYFRTDEAGRGLQTVVERHSDTDPGGDDQLDLLFPGITTFDQRGVGDLWWLKPDARVTVRKLHTDGTTVTSIFTAVVGPVNDVVTPAAPNQLNSFQRVRCVGLWIRLGDFITLPRPSIDAYLKPIPLGHLTPVDSAQFIYAHVHRARLYGWPGVMSRPANSGILTADQGNYGDPIPRTVQTVLADMQRSSSFYTFTNHGSRFVLTTRTWGSGHFDFSFRAGQRGLTHDLTEDPAQAVNAFYGHGLAPFGSLDPSTGRPPALADWHNWQYPFVHQNTPTYPLPLGVVCGVNLFCPGSGAHGFQVFSDELRAHGYDLDSGDTYLAGDEDEIRRFQSNSGDQVDGTVGPQTWNTAFQVSVNARLLASAYIKEIYTASPYSPFLTNSRGGIVAPNPGFDPTGHPRREVLEQYGTLARRDATKSAKEEYDRTRAPYLRGTVTATNLDPTEMPALDTHSGMTMKLQNHQGVDRLLYVAQTGRVPGMVAGTPRSVTWTVSEQPDGLMTLAQRMLHKQGIRDQVSSNHPPRHAAKQIPTWPIFDAEGGAGVMTPGQAQFPRLWNKYLIAMGAQLDVNAVKIIADTPTVMAAAMFANPRMTVEHLISLPGLADPSFGVDGFTDPWATNQERLLELGLCWATGSPNAIQGFWPNQPGGTLTGVLADTSSWPFRANSTVGALFVWTQLSCHVSGDPANKYRVIYPNPAA